MITAAPSVPTRLLDLAPEIKERYQAYASYILDDGSLDERARAVAALAAAVALGNPAVVRSFLTSAKQVGLANEDLGHVSAIVDLVRTEAQLRAFDLPAAKTSKSCC